VLLKRETAVVRITQIFKKIMEENQTASSSSVAEQVKTEVSSSADSIYPQTPIVMLQPVGKRIFFILFY